MSRVTRALVPIAVFAALAVAWTFPLVLHLSTTLPGQGLSDNATFVWNFWWMRAALASGQTFFQTGHLFAPVGVNLALDTHTALPALFGATVLGRLSVIEARNVVLLIEIVLNGCAAYLLARRTGADRPAALLAGVMFAGSPYMAAQMNGHFNLTAAWTIPLFALAMSAAAKGSWPAGALAGVVLGATFYIDYYYVVFEGALAVCLVAAAARSWSVSFGAWTRSWSAFRRVIGAVGLIDVCLITWVFATGGGRLTLAGHHVDVHSVYNPLQILWLLVAVWIVLRARPRVVARAADAPWSAAHAFGAVGATAAVGLAIAGPVLWHASHLLSAGDYATQRYGWRSAPSGVDLATLVLGHPFHGVWGSAVSRLYGRFAIDPIEQLAWLGVVPMVLTGWAVRARWRDERVRLWTGIGGVFFLWALGPHLVVFGHDTAMMLPETLLRYVPLAANARIPGRAMVLVYLAVAILSAHALTALRSRVARPTLFIVAAAAVVLAEYDPAPYPLAPLTAPHLYETLRDRPESGAVCELPLGMADGFGESGQLDRHVLFYQSIHGRPLVGGFVARLPPSLVAAYRADLLISSLLDLSAGGDAPGARVLPDRASASTQLQRDHIRFVVLNREIAPRALAAYVDDVLPLQLVAREGARDLFVVTTP